MIRNNLSGGNTMQRKALHLLGLTMLLSPAAQTVNASTVLVGAPNPLGSFFYGLYSDYAHAAEFTLADSYNVSTIEVMLRTPSTTSFNTFDFSLQDSLTSPSTIFASAALTAPLGTVSTQVMNVNRTLPAGTYYLQVLIPGYYPTPVIPNDVNGWMLSDRDYIQAAGTVADGLWFLSGSSPSFSSGEINGYSYYAPVFTVNGDPVVVPLPAALYLFGAGLVGLVGIARRGKTT